jgi:hypothetical protein
MSLARNNPDLVEVFLLGRNGDTQLGRFNQALFQRFLTDGPGFVNQQITALALGLVTGQTRPPQEFVGICPLDFHCGKEGLPVVVKLDQDLIGDFTR